MLKRLLLVVAACGSAPAEKPAEPKPPAYTCATAVAAMVKPMDLDADRKASARRDLESSCTNTKWPDAFIACASAGSQPCEDTRTPAQKADAQHVLAMLALPSECAQYLMSIEFLTHCDKFPQATKDAMKQGRDAMMAGWNFADMPPDARKAALDAAATSCKYGADAIAQGMKAAGC